MFYSNTSKGTTTDLMITSFFTKNAAIKSGDYFGLIFGGFEINRWDKILSNPLMENSATPNLMMKDFQTRGLFGARDVHKRILDIYYPKFNEKSEIHLQLAELSEKAHILAAKYLADNVDSDQKIEGIHLGKIRLEIKAHLSEELKEIDKLVKQIIG